jgi:hypothetical protein
MRAEIGEPVFDPTPGAAPDHLPEKFLMIRVSQVFSLVNRA